MSGRRTCTQCGARGYYPEVKGEQWFKPNKHDDGIVDICKACKEKSVNQFEYVTATSGYMHCACVECTDVTVGTKDTEMCCLCEEAGCEDSDSCQRDDIHE